MKVINGRSTHIKIMIDDVEDTALEQIQSMANHPAMRKSNIVIMPDCHAGAGCVIGFTQDISKNNYIIPNLIGVDIGCGVLAVNMGQLAIDLKEFDEFVKTNIPHGFKHREKIHGFANSIGTLSIPSDSYEKDWIKEKENSTAIKKQIGTLGGGNHFIEIGIDSKNNKWLFIHSGSRNFGLKTAQYFQSKAKELCDAYFVNVPKGTEFIHRSSDLYLGYMRSMMVAENFARVNREAIASDIINELQCRVLERFDTVHNYVDTIKQVVRKGAISAELDELCTIPFNMRDGVIIGKGKGNKKWNYSAPHGAGRVMSRTIAKKTLNPDDLKKEMEDSGVYTTTAHLAVDEAPQAYKDQHLIVDAISDTVDIIYFVKPIYNFKSH